MAQVVLLSSVAGNTHICGREEVTGLGNFTRETCGFLSTDFCCFLGETNRIYNSRENNLPMLFSGQEVISKRLFVLKHPDSWKLCFSRKSNQLF